MFNSFSTPAASQPPTASTSFFGAPAAAPSLFGGAPPASSAPSLFGGAAAAAPASTGFGGAGLFGSTPAAAPKPAFGGFGGFSTATPAPGVAAAAAGGGLFGAAPAAAAKPAYRGFGSFSSSATAPSVATPTFGFGGQPAAAAPSLFGGFGSAGVTPAPAGGLFGAAPVSAPSAAGLGGPALNKAFKFNDLPDGVRGALEGLDAMIREQIGVSEELKTRDLGSEITTTSALYEQYSSETIGVSNSLAHDTRLVAELRIKLETDLADMAKATAIIEGFKSPQTKGPAAKAVANFPFEYFSRKADEFRGRIATYRSTMDQIQHQVESSHGLERNPSAIVPTLRAQHTSFMALASQVAALDGELAALRDAYRAIWREKTGSVQDPFARRGKGGVALEQGMEGVRIR